jgi:hypothetical protein
VSVEVICPDCRTNIPLNDINVSTDIALCRQCSRTFSYGELAADAWHSVDLGRPPQGAWFRRDARGFEMGASTRHPSAFFIVPFMCVWSGFSLGGIYGTQITKGQLNLMMSLFGIPFLVGTLFFGGIALMTVCGKISVAVQNDSGTVFAGVGPIGWRRKFKWSEVRNIQRTLAFGRRATEQITITADRRIDFASALNSERLNFLFVGLRQIFREPH